MEFEDVIADFHRVDLFLQLVLELEQQFGTRQLFEEVRNEILEIDGEDLEGPDIPLLEVGDGDLVSG